MKPILFVTTALIIITALTGCASIVSGSSQEVSINSKPEKADVRIFNNANVEIWNSKTPATVTLKRGDGFFKGADYRVEISKEGYETKTLMISSSINGGWYIAGNLIIGGFLGWIIIDPASGAMWKLEPESINVTLEETLSEESSASGSRNTQDGLIIVSREDIDDDVFEELDPERLN
jgi:hypothetical protein